MLTKERNIGLDIVKIIAMIMVVGLHVQVGGGLAPSELLRLQYGAELCAIPLFFMVSGYLMQTKMPDFKYVAHKIFNIIKYVLLSSVLLVFALVLLKDIHVFKIFICG